MGRLLFGVVAALLLAPVRGQEPRFTSSVDLIRVTATVTDETGHFISGLQQSDFAVFDDGHPVTLTQFSAERVPVSLGLAVDTSGSMVGQKIRQARTAL